MTSETSTQQTYRMEIRHPWQPWEVVDTGLTAEEVELQRQVHQGIITRAKIRFVPER